jgi:hypothetical protein
MHIMIYGTTRSMRSVGVNAYATHGQQFNFTYVLHKLKAHE